MRRVYRSKLNRKVLEQEEDTLARILLASKRKVKAKLGFRMADPFITRKILLAWRQYASNPNQTIPKGRRGRASGGRSRSSLETK